MIESLTDLIDSLQDAEELLLIDIGVIQPREKGLIQNSKSIVDIE